MPVFAGNTDAVIPPAEPAQRASMLVAGQAGKRLTRMCRNVAPGSARRDAMLLLFAA